MNLTTDDVFDEMQRLTQRKDKKPKPNYKVYDNNGKLLFEGNSQPVGGKVAKHFELTARWSKKGRWRQILKDNNYTVINCG